MIVDGELYSSAVAALLTVTSVLFPPAAWCIHDTRPLWPAAGTRRPGWVWTRIFRQRVGQRVRKGSLCPRGLEGNQGEPFGADVCGWETEWVEGESGGVGC